MVALVRAPESTRRSRLFIKSDPAERRKHPRVRCDSEAQCRRIDHTICAHRQPHVKLELQDISRGGLAATVDGAMEQGERVFIAFPGRARGDWDTAGRVVRCTPMGNRFQIAVEFEQSPMAA